MSNANIEKGHQITKVESLNHGNISRIIIKGGNSLMVQISETNGLIIGEGRATFENPIPVILEENGLARGKLIYDESGPLRQTCLQPPFPEQVGHITFKFGLVKEGLI